MTVTEFHPIPFSARQVARRMFGKRSHPVPEAAASSPDAGSLPGRRLADGRLLAAGLTWEKLTVTADLPRIGVPQPRLRHGDRIARLEDSIPIPANTGSLLLAAATSLLADPVGDDVPPGTWLFLARLDRAEESYWIGFAELDTTNAGKAGVRPLPRCETLISGIDTAVETTRAELATTNVTGIAICATCRNISEDLADAVDNMLAAPEGAHKPTLRLVTPRPLDLPVFSVPLHLPARPLGLIGLAGAGLLTAILTLPPIIAAALRTPPPPAPDLVAVAPVSGGFATACGAGLSTWWPRVTGWQLVRGGCALPRHLPPGLAVQIDPPGTGTLPVIIWQRLARAQEANAVLADGAAERVLADWTGGRIIAADHILLWQVRPIPLVVLDPDADLRSRRHRPCPAGGDLGASSHRRPAHRNRRHERNRRRLHHSGPGNPGRPLRPRCPCGRSGPRPSRSRIRQPGCGHAPSLSRYAPSRPRRAIAGGVPMIRRLAARLFTASLVVLAALSPDPVLAQTGSARPSGVLGIDCETPRLNDAGRILLDLGGTQRRLCEADRETALAWARILESSRDRIAGRVEHASAADLRRLITSMEAGNGLSLFGTTDLRGHFRNSAGRANMPFDVSAWVPHLRAGLCVDNRRFDRGARLIVWLLPQRADRWSPEMAQHTVFAWRVRSEDVLAARERTPDILMRRPAGAVFGRAGGAERALPDCVGDLMTAAGITGTPAWPLAMDYPVRWTVERETRVEPCPNGELGRVRLRRFGLNGVWLDENGLLLRKSGTVVTDPADAWVEIGRLCFHPAAIVPAPLPPDWKECKQEVTIDRHGTVTRRAPAGPDCNVPGIRKTCRAVHGTSHPLGTRTYGEHRITKPDGRKYTGRRFVREACYRMKYSTRTRSRSLSCPAGYSGAVRETRTDQVSVRIWSTGRQSHRSVSTGSWRSHSDNCERIPPPPPPVQTAQRSETRQPEQRTETSQPDKWSGPCSDNDQKQGRCTQTPGGQGGGGGGERRDYSDGDYDVHGKPGRDGGDTRSGNQDRDDE